MRKLHPGRWRRLHHRTVSRFVNGDRQAGVGSVAVPLSDNISHGAMNKSATSLVLVFTKTNKYPRLMVNSA